MKTTTLTKAQHKKLDILTDNYPDAIVVGYGDDADKMIPIIKLSAVEEAGDLAFLSRRGTLYR